MRDDTVEEVRQVGPRELFVCADVFQDVRIVTFATFEAAFVLRSTYIIVIVTFRRRRNKLTVWTETQIC